MHNYDYNQLKYGKFEKFALYSKLTNEKLENVDNNVIYNLLPLYKYKIPDIDRLINKFLYSV